MTVCIIVILYQSPTKSQLANANEAYEDIQMQNGTSLPGNTAEENSLTVPSVSTNNLPSDVVTLACDNTEDDDTRHYETIKEENEIPHLESIFVVIEDNISEDTHV